MVRICDTSSGEVLELNVPVSRALFSVRMVSDWQQPVIRPKSGISATGKMRIMIPGHLRFVGCVAFSPDGKRLATGESPPSSPGPNAVPLGSDGNLKALDRAIDHNSVAIWDRRKRQGTAHCPRIYRCSS